MSQKVIFNIIKPQLFRKCKVLMKFGSRHHFNIQKSIRNTLLIQNSKKLFVNWRDVTQFVAIVNMIAEFRISIHTTWQ